MNNYRNGIIKRCQACEQEYYVPVYRISVSKFCSRDCQLHKQHIQTEKSCLSCGAKFSVSRSRVLLRKYCKKCNHPSRHDEKLARQQRNVAMRIRRGTYSQGFLRKITLKRCGSKCVHCGYNEHVSCLDVHHMDGNPNNNNENNVVLLCVMCHRMLHRGLINVL